MKRKSLLNSENNRQILNKQLLFFFDNLGRPTERIVAFFRIICIYPTLISNYRFGQSRSRSIQKYLSWD